MQLLIRALTALLPQSLLRRVAVLYVLTLTLLISAGLAAFIAHKARAAVEDAEQGAAAISALIMPTLTESAVIGDYDTIKRLLARCVEHPLFEKAVFIDIKGSRVEVARQDRPARAPPAWFTRQFSDLLPPINDFVRAGGRDYGITRLTMWSEYVAAEVWSVVTIALLYGLVGLVLGATVVWWPLKSWLGELDRVSAMGDALVGRGPALERVEADAAPLEFQRTFAVINKVAASLQAERAQAAVTLTAIAEGVATLNGEGAIVLANPVMGELLHRPSSSLLGQRLAEVLPALGFAGEPRETWRNRRVHLDGPPACTLEASLTLVSAEGDQAAGWVLVLRDITQQQQLEDQLRDELESRATAIRAMSDLLGPSTSVSVSAEHSVIERLSRQVADLVSRLQRQTDQLGAIFTLSPDGFISFDAERRVQFVSPSVPLLTGLDSRDILHQDEAGLERLLTQRQVNASTQKTVSLAQLHEDALILHMDRPMQRILALAMHAGGGREVSQVLHIRDVSQQFEVDRLKSEFLTTAAHELRTPMTSIYGFTELLTTRQLSPERQRELLGRIYRQSRAMMDILDELLDLARIEARSAQDFVFTQVLLEDLARETAEDFQPPEGRTPVELLLQAPGVQLRVDAGKLRQALRNVISNAYKYSPGGGAVGLRVSATGEGWARIEVRDEGIGMSADDLERVTERFFRADKSGKIPGTGLGMALVKEIVQLLGGRMHLSSELGQGTTVTLEFPVALRSATAEHALP